MSRTCFRCSFSSPDGNALGACFDLRFATEFGKRSMDTNQKLAEYQIREVGFVGCGKIKAPPSSSMHVADQGLCPQHRRVVLPPPWQTPRLRDTRRGIASRLSCAYVPTQLRTYVPTQLRACTAYLRADLAACLRAD